MRKISLIMLAVISLFAGNLFSQDTNKLRKSNVPEYEMRNSWNLAVVYGERGFGLNGGIFKQLGNTVDIFANLSISGVTDTREFDQYDIYGNPITFNKVNRVYLIPLSIGIQRHMFKEELDASLKPILTAGVTTGLIVTTPYDKGFFESFKYAQSSYTLGGFIGLALEFEQNKTISFVIGVKYFYLPVLGREISSIRDQNIKDVGGIVLNFGVNFLRKTKL